MTPLLIPVGLRDGDGHRHGNCNRDSESEALISTTAAAALLPASLEIGLRLHGYSPFRFLTTLANTCKPTIIIAGECVRLLIRSSLDGKNIVHSFSNGAVDYFLDSTADRA
jgi:hypothetical protein